MIAPTSPTEARESDQDDEGGQEPPARQHPPSSPGLERQHQQPEEFEQHPAKPQTPTLRSQQSDTSEERLKLHLPTAEEGPRGRAGTERTGDKPTTPVRQQQQQHLTQLQREKVLPELGANLAVGCGFPSENLFVTVYLASKQLLSFPTPSTYVASKQLLVSILSCPRPQEPFHEGTVA